MPVAYGKLIDSESFLLRCITLLHVTIKTPLKVIILSNAMLTLQYVRYVEIPMVVLTHRYLECLLHCVFHSNHARLLLFLVVNASLMFEL